MNRKLFLIDDLSDDRPFIQTEFWKWLDSFKTGNYDNDRAKYLTDIGFERSKHRLDGRQNTIMRRIYIGYGEL